MKDLPGCCNRVLLPLPQITVNVKKRKGYHRHDSHYYDYAFECLECGAVYEIIIEDYSYESIGDFMQPNYTSWSTRPAPRDIDQGSCKGINEKYGKQISDLTDEGYKIQGQIESQIPCMDSISAREELRASLNNRRQEIDENIKNLRKQKKAEIRKVLGLPPISKEYREDRFNKKYKIEELKQKLESNQRQLDSVNELIAKINSKDKLLSVIHKIEKEIQSLNEFPHSLDIRKGDRAIQGGKV